MEGIQSTINELTFQVSTKRNPLKKLTRLGFDFLKGRQKKGLKYLIEHSASRGQFTKWLAAKLGAKTFCQDCLYRGEGHNKGVTVSLQATCSGFDSLDVA